MRLSVHLVTTNAPGRLATHASVWLHGRDVVPRVSTSDDGVGLAAVDPEHYLLSVDDAEGGTDVVAWLDVLAPDVEADGAVMHEIAACREYLQGARADVSRRLRRSDDRVSLEFYVIPAFADLETRRSVLEVLADRYASLLVTTSVLRGERTTPAVGHGPVRIWTERTMSAEQRFWVDASDRSRIATAVGVPIATETVRINDDMMSRLEALPGGAYVQLVPVVTHASVDMLSEIGGVEVWDRVAQTRVWPPLTRA